MKKSIFITTGLLVALATAVSTPAQAQFGDLKKSLKKEAVKKAKKEIKKEITRASKSAPTSSTVTSQTASYSGGASGSLPASNLQALTQCSSLKPTNIMVGKQGNYTFQSGMSQEKRSGLISRRNVNLSNGCFLPSMETYDVLYMEVDTAKYKGMGPNDWEWQCVESNNPSGGTVNKADGVYQTSFLSGKDLLLHCGNSEGISDCATGKNNKRSGEWKSRLRSQGKTMISAIMPAGERVSAPDTMLYCHYYNKAAGQALVGFEYYRRRR